MTSNVQGYVSPVLQHLTSRTRRVVFRWLLFNGRFIFLGSAQPRLIKGVSESLAGRVAMIDLASLTAQEAATGDTPCNWQTVWLRGGFPNALRGDFRLWWESYLRTLFERDLPQYGVSAQPAFIRRLLTMLAHQHGGLLNASSLSASLAVSYHTVQNYIDVLESVFLIRKLSLWFTNIGKRLIKAPKVYLRDTGLLHHLLNISTLEQLQNHPSRGASWEGFVIEDVLRREQINHQFSQPWFWRTASGAEVDVLLDRGSERIAIEVKAGRGDNARGIRALRDASTDVNATRCWIVDQHEGIASLGPSIARAGFSSVIEGSP